MPQVAPPTQIAPTKTRTDQIDDCTRVGAQLTFLKPPMMTIPTRYRCWARFCLTSAAKPFCNPRTLVSNIFHHDRLRPIPFLNTVSPTNAPSRRRSPEAVSGEAHHLFTFARATCQAAIQNFGSKDHLGTVNRQCLSAVAFQ